MAIVTVSPMSTDTASEKQIVDDKLYVGPAKEWILQVVVIGIIAGAINAVIVLSRPGFAPVFTILVNLTAVVIASFLLFRHVDTLILKRLAQMEGRNQNAVNNEK